MTGKIIGALREQSDWEQNNEHRLGFIKNKPFYDTRKTETAPLTLEFDGNIGDRETVDATATMGAYYVKLSDLTPTCEELNGGTLEFYSEGSVETMTIEGTIDRKAYGTTLREMMGGMVVVEGAFIDDFGAYFSSGLWILYAPGEAWTQKIYLPSCSVTTGELKTIDPKFLPSGGVGYTETTKKTLLPEQTFQTEILAEGLYMFILPSPLDISDGDNLTVIWNGEQYVCKASLMEDSEGVPTILFGNMAVMGEGVDTGEPFFYTISGEGGGTFLTNENGTFTVNVTVETETIHTIDPKYLPSGDKFFDLNQYGLTVTEPVSLSPNEAKDLIEKILNGEIIGLRETTPIDDDGHQKQTLPFIRVCMQGSVDGAGTMLIAYVQKEVADTPPVSFTGLIIAHDETGGEVSLMAAE